MVNCHDGYASAERALVALAANIAHYGSKGFLVGCYVQSAQKSFEVSVHWRDGVCPELIEGLEPTSYYDKEYTSDDNYSFKVRHMYFSLHRLSPDAV